MAKLLTRFLFGGKVKRLNGRLLLVLPLFQVDRQQPPRQADVKRAVLL